jgi:hypothetical protein
LLRLQPRAAALAVIEELASVGRHGFGGLMAALRASEGGDKLHRRGSPDDGWQNKLATAFAIPISSSRIASSRANQKRAVSKRE